MFTRTTLVLSLLVGAVGIGILWAAGVDFPVAVPPGIIILLVGAVVAATVRRRWSDGLGAMLGLFVVVGFILSAINGEGFDNLVGRNGNWVSIGQVVQLIGVTFAAVVGGVLVFRRP